MPIRGENIGTAYIRIIADGSNLSESIKDEFRDAEDAWEQMGSRSSKAYQDGFDEQYDRTSKSRVNALVDRIRSASGRFDAVGRQMASDLLDPITNQMRSRFGDEIGSRLARDIERGFRRSGGSLDVIERFVDNLSANVERVTKEIVRDEERMHSEALAMNREFDRQRLEQQKEMLAEALRMNKEFDAASLKSRLDADKEWELNVERLAREHTDMEEQRRKDIKFRITLERAYAENARRDAAAQQRAIANLRTAFVFLNREAGQLLKGDRNARPRKELLDLITHIRAEMGRLNLVNSVWNETLRDTENELRRSHPHLDGFVRNMDRVSDSIGTGFGRGSRNDFLNFIGSLTRNISRLVLTGLPRLVGGLLNLGAGFREAEGAGGKFRFVLARLGGVFASVIGGIGGLFAIVGPMTAILSSLAGVVVALASSLSFALVGAVSSLAAVALPAAAGVGALALAFYDLEKAEKKALKADIKPLTNSFGELADVTREGVFGNLGEQASRLSRVLDGLQPMFRRIGNAISDVGDSWLDSMEGPGFERWRDLMTIFLPDAIRSLGRIAGNVIGGMGGLFTGMIPFMRDALGWLERITKQFSDWANSTTGQGEIVAFFERTKESLADVGDFLGSVRDLFVELISAGQGAGDGLFASMSDSIDRWVASIRANPDILRDWFKQAEDFGRVMGNVLTGIGKLFSALDNAFSRGAVTFVFDALATGIEGLASALEFIARMLGIGEDAFMGFAGQAAAAAFIIPKFNRAIAGSNMVGFVSNLRTAETRMGALSRAARGAAGVGGIMALVGASNSSNDAVSGLLNVLGGAATGFAVGGPWGALIGGAAGGALALFGDKANEASDAAKAGQQPVLDYASTFDTLTGAVTAATREMVVNDLRRRGAASTAAQLGLSFRTVTQAALGNRDAIALVNSTLNKATGYTVMYTDSLGSISTKTVGSRREVMELNAAVRAQGGEIKNVQTLYANSGPRSKLLSDLKSITGAWKGASAETRENIIAAQDLSSIYKTIPKRKATKIEAEGVVPTTRGIAKVADRYDLLPRQIASLIEATGVDTTVKRVKNVQSELDKTDKKRPTPKLDMDPQQFNNKLRDSNASLDRLVRGNYVPRIDVNNEPARAGINLVEQWLNSIPDEEVSINVTRRERTLVTPSEGRRTATGGIFGSEQWRFIGESGPEAVVPLNRPLMEVDPAVRWLSAIAQGKAAPSGGAGPKNVIAEGAITVVAPSADPYAVAVQTLNEITGRLN